MQISRHVVVRTGWLACDQIPMERGFAEMFVNVSKYRFQEGLVVQVGLVTCSMLFWHSEARES